MAHVFISYSKENEKFAERLATRLIQESFDFWIDTDQIEIGDEWWRKICKAIVTSSALIVIMTPESRASEWVRKEVEIAQKLGIPILPILLEGETFEELKGIHHLDYLNSTSQSPLDTLCKRLNKIVGQNKQSRLGENIVGTEINVPSDMQDKINYIIETVLRESKITYPRKSHENSYKFPLQYVRQNCMFIAVILTLIAILLGTSIVIAFRDRGGSCEYNGQLSYFTVVVRLANGANIYNAPSEDSARNALVYQFGDQEPRELEAYAWYLDGEHLWFFIDHPVQEGFYGWVDSDEVAFDRQEYDCLPEYTERNFPSNSYPVFDAP